MDAGWNLQGEAYKALLWGAASSKVRAVIGSPPSKGLEAMRDGWGTNVHDARYHKELEILAKQLFLFLLSYTANDGTCLGYCRPFRSGGRVVHYNGAAV